MTCSDLTHWPSQPGGWPGGDADLPKVHRLLLPRLTPELAPM